MYVHEVLMLYTAREDDLIPARVPYGHRDGAFKNFKFSNFNGK